MGLELVGGRKGGREERRGEERSVRRVKGWKEGGEEKEKDEGRSTYIHSEETSDES